MRIRDFQLERYFAKYEFSARHLLSPSDCEPVSMSDLLGMASKQDLRRWEELVLGYTESAGLPELRARIAELQGGISADDILCAVPEEGIFLAMNALLEPGDRVIALHPAYQSLYEIARSIGCKVERWPLLNDGEKWRLDLQLLRELLQERTKLVVVNFPHNPTGFQPTQNEFAQILEAAEASGARVFSDEMYRGLESGGADRLPSAAAVSDTAVSLSGLSKTYALPGLRSGWLACRDPEFIAAAQSLKDYTTICAPGPVEALSLIALDNAESLAARSRNIVAGNLELAVDFFLRKRDAGFNLIPPIAGSICLAELNTGESAYDFCEAAVKTANVMVVPSVAFDMDGEFIRLGLGRSSFGKALAALESFIEQRT
jgi:aspartate/methionine/tyrosine aminotransferase